MRHLEDIAALVRTLHSSKKFHSLVIQSPPGWAKSTTIDRLLKNSEVRFRSLGAYTTPLGLYNELSKFPDQTLVLDDCTGIFNDSAAMSVLKAATWTSVGADAGRKVTWVSTSDKVIQPSFTFTGKIVLTVNSVPSGQDVRAFLTRSLFLELRFSPGEIHTMLREAALSTVHYDDLDLAKTVVEKLIGLCPTDEAKTLNLRTLQMAYEIARANPENWQDLLLKLLPTISPRRLAEQLSFSDSPVNEQLKEFVSKTGLSRRTFFNYRNEQPVG